MLAKGRKDVLMKKNIRIKVNSNVIVETLNSFETVMSQTELLETIRRSSDLWFEGIDVLHIEADGKEYRTAQYRTPEDMLPSCIMSMISSGYHEREEDIENGFDVSPLGEYTGNIYGNMSRLVAGMMAEDGYIHLEVR